MLMIEIGFVDDLTPIIMIVAGMIGLAFSSERLISFLPFFGDTKDKDSLLLKWLSVVLAVTSAVWVCLLFIDDLANYHWVSIVIFFLFIVVVVAQPIRDFEGWHVILLATPLVLMTIVGLWFRSGKQFEVVGIEIPLWLVLGIVSLLMLILFVIVFVVEETTIDPILFFIQWAPVVLAVCFLMVIQGLLLLIFPTNGIAEFLGDLIGKI